MTELQQPLIVGLGEVLWDLLPNGPQFGGAPANFACHAGQLGACAATVSCVGHDDLGNQAIEELGRRTIASNAVSRSELATGTVEISLDNAGKPTYSILQNVAWDEIPWNQTVADLSKSAAAACFGSLGQRSESSKQTIQRFLREMPAESLRIFDINLRPPFVDPQIILHSLELANVLKLSDEELPTLVSHCNLSEDVESALQQLTKQYDLKVVALTCGSRGSLLTDGTSIVRQAAQPTSVVDTVGAGDAFTAVLAAGMLRGLNLEEISQVANRVAAFVCSQSGATPQIPPELVPWLPRAMEKR